MALPAKAQPGDTRLVFRLQDTLTKVTTDTLKARFQYALAYAYYDNRFTLAGWPDSVTKYANLSIRLCLKKGYTTLYGNIRRMQVNAWAMQGQHRKAIALADLMNDSYAMLALWDMGDYYSQSGPGVRRNLDSAYCFFQKALVISEQLKSNYWSCLANRRMAVYYCRKDDTLSAKKYATVASSYFKEPKDIIANMWYDMGWGPGLTEPYFAFKLYCYNRSLSIARQLESKGDTGIKLTIGRTYMSMGDVYEFSGKDSISTVYFQKALEILKAIKDKGIYLLHIRLFEKCYYKGNIDKAVYHALEGMKSAETAGVKNLHQFYLYLGNAYFEMGEVAKSIDYYEKGFASARMSDRIINGVMIKRMARSMVAAGRAAEALPYVQHAIKDFIAPKSGDSMLKAEALGICYNGLGQYDLAEKYYLEMARYIPRVDKYHVAICPYVWGKFYYERGQYDKSARYLHNCLQLPPTFFPRWGTSEVYLMLYRIDSSRQQYQSALNYYLLHKRINDSIFVSGQNRQMEEFRIKYDMSRKDQELISRAKDIELLTQQKLLQQALAEQKSKDVLLKQQRIDLLTQEASLQELLTEKQEAALQQQEKDIRLQQDNIGLLRNREHLQDTQLKQANFIKQLTIGGVVLLVIILGLLYNQYRIKKKNNFEISGKNEKLHNLVEEKEWLLKEVHHRVKNNLQVVLSLLQSQSAYLKDDALAAIHDSQHRVQAMSLIHQKLYQTDNIATIDMHIYVPELVQYLKESFDTPARIRFLLEVAPIQLDVKQAIPLGLIINEAITNVFKHAFPNRDHGQVRISLQPRGEEEIALSIVDDGVGLPPGYEQSRKGSLGMSLLKGLCSDFQGRHTIESRNGTRVQVVFGRGGVV